MKSYESILAFLCGRRICRLSWSIFQLAVYSRRTSIFISFLSIVSLLSSVAAVQQQQVVNQQEQRTPSLSSIISTNGTTTTTTAFNNSRRRSHTTMPLLSSTILPTTTITTAAVATITINDELINKTNNSIHHENNTRHLVHLIIIITICSLMCILTIVGNLVVILAVSIVRKLQTASNILIVSLAVSDVFVGLFIMPLALVLEISNNTWILGSAMCDIWTSTDVLLCTSSILNFLVISIDRYCIINHPFKYAPMRKVKLLSLMIAGVWILSALVSLPPILGWGRPSENLPICQVNPKLAYQIFATMLSFYIPLIIVLIIYANIYRTARTAMDPRSSVQMSQFLTNNSSSPNVAHTSEVLDQQLNGNSCSTPQLYLSVSNANTHDDNLLTSDGNRRSKRSENSPPQRSKSATLLSPTRCLGRRISTTINGRLSIFVARRYSIFRHVHLPNQKAIRTLGVILGTFIVCWLPFMLYAIIKPLHERITGLTGTPKQLNAPVWLDSVLLWFGYSSSMLNPLIYSKFNREFRTPFREIIYCRCKGLNEKIRRQEYLENLYGENHSQLPVPSHLATTTRSSGNPKSAV